MKVPVNEPVISNESQENVISAVQSGWISSSGPFVKKFENDFASFLGVKHAITVSSGTAALHVSLLSLGIGKGDEVIVPAFTMGATWLAVLYTGAKPVFVDCTIEDYNIDVSKIEEKITSRTKAILPVHIYGNMADMDVINAIAKKYNLHVIEDAAQAHGATYKGKLSGTLGLIGCFSFYANKIITTGEGGMIVTNDDVISKRVLKIKDLHHSEDKRFIHDGVGFNYRMTNLQAAVGCGELLHIKEYVQKKRWMAEKYIHELKNIKGIYLPRQLPNTNGVFWMFPVYVEDSLFGLSRNKLRTALLDKGIDTRDFFYPPEEQPVLKKIIRRETFPNASILSKNGLYLPSGLAVTEKQIFYVCSSLKEIHSCATS